MSPIDSLKTENKFKKTEIREIPVDWGIGTINECCEILDSQRVPLNDAQRRIMRGPFPYYGANGLIDHVNDYLFDDDLILMAEDGGYFDEYRTRPIAYMVTGKCWVNNHAHILKAKEGWDQKWIYYSVVHKNILPYIAGGTRSKLTQADLKAIQIPAPPLQEQTKISKILSTVDRAIEKIGEVIEKTKQLKKWLLHELLRHGIGHNKFKISPLGEIPEEWEVRTLNDCVAKFIDYRGKTPKKSNHGIPLITARNIREDYIDSSEQEFIPEESYDRWMIRGLPEIGDVLFTTEAPLGNVAQLQNSHRVALAQRIIALRARKPVLSNEFLKYYLLSERGKAQVLKKRSGSTVVGIKQKELRKVLISLPPLREQKKIADVISGCQEELEQETTQKTKLENLKKGLMQILLTGKARVE